MESRPFEGKRNPSLQLPRLNKQLVIWVLLSALGAALMWGGFQCRAKDQAQEVANAHRIAAMEKDREADTLARDLAGAKLAQEKLEAVAARLRALPRAVTKPEEGHAVEVPAGETVTAKGDSILLSKERAAELAAIGESEKKVGESKSGLITLAREEALALARAKRKARAWRNRTALALGVGFVIGYVVGK